MWQKLWLIVGKLVLFAQSNCEQLNVWVGRHIHRGTVGEEMLMLLFIFRDSFNSLASHVALAIVNRVCRVPSARSLSGCVE